MVTTLTNLEELEHLASDAFSPLRMHAATTARSYRGRFHTSQIGDVSLTRITGEAVTVRRDRPLIHSDDPEIVKVAWQRSGRAGVEQDGRRCVIEPGHLVAYDTTRPYELPFWEPYELVVAAIPHTALSPHTDLVRARTACPVTAETGTQRIFNTFVTELADPSGPTAASNAGTYLADALVSLILSAFAGTAPEQHRPAETLFQQIQTYCLRHLADPDLSIRTVAAAHHISTRYLHKLAHESGISLANWIRTQRLRRIRADLANPALTHHAPSVIAARWGVLDTKHLSRSLKAEFDETPTQIRRRTHASR